MTTATETGQLRVAAAEMRKRAREASTSSTGRWVLRRTGGYPQSVVDDASATLIADTYTDPSAAPATARHILAWDVEVALQVATWLDVVAHLTERGECPVEMRECAADLAAVWLRNGEEDTRRENLDDRP